MNCTKERLENDLHCDDSDQYLKNFSGCDNESQTIPKADKGITNSYLVAPHRG